ncbi:putative homeobox transcription factor [Planoprotostelium fungivorum]|uniref:Putative homeobox transcription factor n=1 Tax=Planoprotostelium fungivorum TaxID=1890364 RepID=A0A2P6NXH9_9EUKA|nr:putative homeobox transcription factor [Planoprotostelium fungivorum]
MKIRAIAARFSATVSTYSSLQNVKNETNRNYIAWHISSIHTELMKRGTDNNPLNLRGRGVNLTSLRRCRASFSQDLLSSLEGRYRKTSVPRTRHVTFSRSLSDLAGARGRVEGPTPHLYRFYLQPQEQPRAPVYSDRIFYTWPILGKRQSTSEEDGRKRDQRTTPRQAAALKEMFSKKPMPSDAEYADLAAQVEMSEKRVRNWFQNRRCKIRRLKNEKETDQLNERSRALSEHHPNPFAHFIRPITETPQRESIVTDTPSETRNPKMNLEYVLDRKDSVQCTYDFPIHKNKMHF